MTPDERYTKALEDVVTGFRHYPMEKTNIHDIIKVKVDKDWNTQPTECTCSYEDDIHSCPYEEDINGNDDDGYCSCCEHCQEQCADNI